MVDAGRFPLGVEPATLANAAALVPAITSITAHARYYALHAVVAARCAELGITDLTQIVDRMRRAEVVLAALSIVHAEDSPQQHHRTAELGDPHGAREIGPVAANGALNVEETAEHYSRQRRGFLATYRGSEIALGLLDPAAGSLAPGPLRASATTVSALEPVLSLAQYPSVTRDQLSTAAAAGCICAVRTSPDGRELQELLFGGSRAGAAPARVLQVRLSTALSAQLLVRSLDGRAADPVPAMADLCCFGDLDTIGAYGRLRDWALRWRGALLRNRSVTAWRQLWWWLTNELAQRPRTAAQLADTFADALVFAAGGDPPARAALSAELPDRRAGTLLRDAESEVLYSGGPDRQKPLDCLRCLVLGAQRLDDLTGAALVTFTQGAELGPRWVQDWVGGLGNTPLSTAGRQLAGFLLHHAEALSRKKTRWEGGRLRLSTRLRPVGDVLTLAGQEGTIPAGLRLERLAEILIELDFLRRPGDHWQRGPAAIERYW